MVRPLNLFLVVFNCLWGNMDSFQLPIRNQFLFAKSQSLQNPIFLQEEDSLENDSMVPPVDSYGFDLQTSSTSPQQEQQQSERLKNSLNESAKFKIRNDARFTWLSTLLVSASYAYGCLGGSDGRDFLEILGIPNGGLFGGLGGIGLALASFILFFAPELFAKKRL